MSHLLLQGDAERIPLADQSVDFVFGSPPYVDCRTYLENGVDLGIARELTEWVEWMLRVTTEALRVCRGAVLWVAAGKTEDRDYWPACEGLMWEWHKRGGSAYRPCYWHRNGVSGSGSDQWFRSDVEYVMCFKRQGPLPWSDNTAMGHPPKWAPGGEMSHRLSDGARVNQWGGRSTSGRGKRANGGERGASGERQNYIPPDLANPGNLIHTLTGGGHMGSDHAHENEAPFPEDLAEFFIKSLCPPGGRTLDCFSGSGTTASVANRLDRHGIGMDLRRTQCDLGKRRIERPHAPTGRGRKEPEPGMSLIDLFGGEN